MAQLRSSLYRAIIQHDFIDAGSIAELRQTPQFEFDTVVNKTNIICKSNEYFERTDQLNVFPDGFLSRNPRTLACECAFLHEYFDHISNDGDISHKVLDKLCSWIDKGECPHVSMAKEDRHLRAITSVSPIHVAVAANNSEMYGILCTSQKVNPLGPDVVELPWDYNESLHLHRNSSFFNLSYIDTAVLKQRHSYLHARPRFSEGLVNVTEKITDSSKIYFRTNPQYPLSLCVTQNDLNMAKILLSNRVRYTEAMRALELCFLVGEANITNEILDFYCVYGKCNPFSRSDNPTETVILSKSILAAAIRDKPELLEILRKNNLLSNARPETVERIQPDIEVAYKLASALGHDKCANILREHVDLTNIQHCNVNPFPSVIGIIIQGRQNGEQSKMLLRKVCECGFDINKRISDGSTVLMANVRRNIPEVIEALIDSGSDVNLQNSSGETALGILLKADRRNIHLDFKGRCFNRRLIRHSVFERSNERLSERMPVLKVLLISNPITTPAIGQTYFNMAVELDSNFLTYGCRTYTSIVEILMDVPAISLQDLATPLLWECGFPVPGRLHTRSLHDLPELLREFLIRVTSQTRSLQMQCRDVLRRQFPGQLLHQFLGLSGCPQRIQDYILLTDLLKNCVRSCEQ